MTPERKRIHLSGLLVVLVISVCIAVTGRTPSVTGTHSVSEFLQPVDQCVECHQKRGDEAVALFQTSVHARARKTCATCHGGTPSADDKDRAHRGRFVGQPSSDAVLNICGSCHTSALEAFRTSRHFPERAGATRVDCVQCHGAHLVGSSSRDFSVAYYCAGCHGLEYLPQLPRELQKALALTDDLKDSIRRLESSGHTLTTEESAQSKEARRMLAEVVHATDVKGGLSKVGSAGERIRDLTNRLNQKK